MADAPQGSLLWDWLEAQGTIVPRSLPSRTNMVDHGLSTLRDWVRIETHGANGQKLPISRIGAVFLRLAVSEVAKLVQYWLLGLLGPGSVLVSERFELLDLAIDAAPRSGLWLEFGVWKGESIDHLAERSGQPIFGFDSFEGLPSDWMPGVPTGHFSTGGELPDVHAGVTLIKGWFDQTLPQFLDARHESRVAFLHVDCDLYSSARTVLTILGRRIDEGTIVVFDEFCGLIPDNEARAWREFCRAERVTFRWLGCSLAGSVALKVISRARSANAQREE